VADAGSLAPAQHLRPCHLVSQGSSPPTFIQSKAHCHARTVAQHGIRHTVISLRSPPLLRRGLKTRQDPLRASRHLRCHICPLTLFARIHEDRGAKTCVCVSRLETLSLCHSLARSLARSLALSRFPSVSPCNTHIRANMHRENRGISLAVPLSKGSHAFTNIDARTHNLSLSRVRARALSLPLSLPPKDIKTHTRANMNRKKRISGVSAIPSPLESHKHLPASVQVHPPVYWRPF